MKNIPLFFYLLIMSLPASAQDYLNIITFNIRYDNPRDSLNAWQYRKDHAASQILFHEAHIVGVQEALYSQVIELGKRLPRYEYVGVGRTDGKQEGEFSAIFFDTRRLVSLQSATFWLSEHPDSTGSRGWDANLPRIVTWAKFRDKKTGLKFFAFNTHFDHIGEIARRESALLLLKKIKAIAGSDPVIVTGDFNSLPTDEPIVKITAADDPLRLTDSKKVSAAPHYGPNGTFTGFEQKEVRNQPIDYIFTKNRVKVLQHATLSQSWEGRFSSDHFPVFARVAIK